MSPHDLFTIAYRCSRVFVEQEKPLWTCLSNEELRTDIPNRIIMAANISRVFYHQAMNDNGTAQTVLPDTLTKSTFKQFIERIDQAAIKGESNETKTQS